MYQLFDRTENLSRRLCDAKEVILAQANNLEEQKRNIGDLRRGYTRLEDRMEEDRVELEELRRFKRDLQRFVGIREEDYGESGTR